MGSLPGLTQKALDSVVEWGQEFTLAMNGAKTVDMVISARREDNIPSFFYYYACISAIFYSFYTK